jgi:hypothetical protein
MTYFQKEDLLPVLPDAAAAIYSLSLKSLLLKGGLRPVATNCSIPGIRGSANTFMNSRPVVKIRGQHSMLYPVFPAFYCAQDSGDKLENGSGAVSLRASLEYPVGTRAPIAFDFGQMDAMIASGGWSIGKIASTVPNGGTAFFPLDIVAPNGVIFSDQRNASAGLEEGLTAGTALLASAAEGLQTPATGGSNCYHPLAVLAYTNQKGYLLIGDSIMHGTGDTPDSSTDMGIAARSIGPSYGYINMGIWGDTLVKFMTSYRRRASFAAVCSDVISNYGNNDILTRTAAQIKADLIKSWSLPDFANCRVWQVNFGPRTSSGATTTPVAGWGPGSVQADLNAWLADGAPMSNGIAVATGTGGALRSGSNGHPLRGVIDIASVLQTGDSGVWADVSDTTDWVHPDLSGYLKVAASSAFAACLAA